jgi:hypothetical protein
MFQWAKIQMGNGQPSLLAVLAEVQLQHKKICVIPGATAVWFMWIYGSEADISVQLTSAVSPCWIASILVQFSNVGVVIGKTPPGWKLFSANVL